LSAPIAPPSLSPLPLHDALPICLFRRLRLRAGDKGGGHEAVLYGENPRAAEIAALLLRLEISDVVGIETHVGRGGDAIEGVLARSEEHTSELQSRFDLVCRLLLE